MQILSNTNLNRNKLQNAVVDGGVAYPDNPVEGQIFYDESDFDSKSLSIYTGSQWEKLQKEPLTGQANNPQLSNYVSPTMAVAAVAFQGRDLMISYTDRIFGALVFSSWNAATSLGALVSNTIVELEGVLFLYSLIGYYSNPNEQRWVTSYNVLLTEITYDVEPRQDSYNPVMSYGIYDALQGKLDTTATATKSQGIPYGVVDASSTSTAFTATVPGITELKDGTIMLLKNGVVTSASGFTININGLGAKPSYNNMAAATADTTLFNINYTMLFIYDSTRISGGCWIMYRGYNSNDNTIGYQLRTNSSTRPASDKFYRYRILFTSADGKKWVPANTSTSTNATASRAVNQRPIDPFGDIVYYGTTTAIEADENVAAAQLWQQYTCTFGYSFNRTGAALVLTYPSPVYIKCAPQADGSAIIDSTTPYVQALPSTADGKIYIYLGRAYSATAVEIVNNHAVYYHDGTGIRRWTGSRGLPAVSATDNGKVLRVENGVWAAAALPNAEEESY